MANIDKSYFEDDPIKQNKIEDILTDDEEILQELKPDKKDYILESIFKGLFVALIWGAIDALIIFLIFKEGQPNAFLTGGLILFFALHLLPVWLYIANVIKRVGGYKNITYVFTNKRIIIRSGLIGIDYKIFYYADISSVIVKVGLWDRLFKVGDLYIQSTGQNAVLEDIKEPYKYLSRVEKIVRDIKADINYPNDLRPKENHGYNTVYKDKKEDK